MIHKSIVTLCFAGVLALAAGAAQAQGANGMHGKTSAEQKFMTDAMQGDMAEVQMGKLAQQKSSNDKVKQFGEKLVADHGANLDKAKSLAQSMNMTPPTGPSAKQKAMYEKLSKLSGSKFDRAFAKSMVTDHKKDIKEFQKESKKSGEAADFAKQTLPTLKEHLQIAESLRKGSRSSTTGSSTSR
jgi:putative membrane protein